MPQFILDTGSPEAALAFERMDDFAKGYIEAMFFTDTGYAEDEELEHATVADLAPETLARIEADCKAFQQATKRLLSLAYHRADYSAIQAGRDFWFSRNEYGVGFFDRGLGRVGERLQDACGWRTKFPEVDLYMGDDEQLYMM